MTAVLPLLDLPFLNENSTWNIARPQTEARPGVAHTLIAPLLLAKTGKPGRSAALGVYALAYRIGLWRSKPECGKSSSQFRVLSEIDVRLYFSENWELGTQSRSCILKRARTP